METENYNRITPERKKTLINMCIAAILKQLGNKTIEQLKRNQANLILKSQYDCLKKGDLVAQKQEEALINSICEELYAKRETVKQITNEQQQRITSELLEKFGIPEKGDVQIGSSVNIEDNPNIGNTEKGTKKTNEINFSSLYNPSMIRTKTNQKNPSIQYVPIPYKRTTNHIYQLQNEKITIRRIGELTYRTLNGENSIFEYLITKEDREGTITEIEKVFTDILISRMEEETEYRNIVLTQLLSNKNLHLPSSHGYIGEITSDWDEKEKTRQYELEYLPESYTAVVELEIMRQEKRKAEEQIK